MPCHQIVSDRKIDISSIHVSKTLKNLHRNVEFFATRFATYFMWNKIKFNKSQELFAIGFLN